jgi:methyl coenzyme M reductase subunit C
MFNFFLIDNICNKIVLLKKIKKIYEAVKEYNIIIEANNIDLEYINEILFEIFLYKINEKLTKGDIKDIINR